MTQTRSILNGILFLIILSSTAILVFGQADEREVFVGAKAAPSTRNR